MSGVRARGEEIRRFILENVEKQPDSVSRLAAEKFGITRQAANKHLQRLTQEGSLIESGNTRARAYKLAPLSKWSRRYPIVQGLEENRVWEDVKPNLGALPTNVMNIWHIGFTEMFNNAIEHSEGTNIWVDIEKTALDCKVLILDDGVGIFEKIKAHMGLEDARHAVLELAKGKFTTDPKNHSGEGIFFTSRMFDTFAIHSKGLSYSHDFGEQEDWIADLDSARGGTGVFLELDNHTSRTARGIYDEFSSIERGFNKTLIPVRLAQHGNDQLVSRSQAKRLLTRVDRFDIVALDFRNVPEIGQGFADEIFRVFAKEHPEIQLLPSGANEAVKRMIAHVLSGESPADAQQSLPLVERDGLAPQDRPQQIVEQKPE
jgi:biotin operon repressor/anti-sigma regulatory factor (Ser/Thr protein kinase)